MYYYIIYRLSSTFIILLIVHTIFLLVIHMVHFLIYCYTYLGWEHMNIIDIEICLYIKVIKVWLTNCIGIH